MDNTTVKLDKVLLEKIKKLLKEEDYRILYTSLKQFINIAVLQLFEEEVKKKSKEREVKK